MVYRWRRARAAAQHARGPSGSGASKAAPRGQPVYTRPPPAADCARTAGQSGSRRGWGSSCPRARATSQRCGGRRFIVSFSFSWLGSCRCAGAALNATHTLPAMVHYYSMAEIRPCRVPPDLAGSLAGPEGLPLRPRRTCVGGWPDAMPRLGGAPAPRSARQRRSARSAGASWRRTRSAAAVRSRCCGARIVRSCVDAGPTAPTTQTRRGVWAGAAAVPRQPRATHPPPPRLVRQAIPKIARSKSQRRRAVQSERGRSIRPPAGRTSRPRPARVCGRRGRPPEAHGRWAEGMGWGAGGGAGGGQRKRM